MKKFFSLLLMLSFLNVQAALPVTNAKALSNAFDSLNYSLTVEWDQVDNTFYEIQKKKLQNSLKDLQNKGMTNAQMLQVLAKKSNSKVMAKEITDLLAVVKANKLTNSEARKYIIDSLSAQQAQGSSWLGSSSTSSIGILLVIMLAIAFADTSSGSSNGYNNTNYNCYTDYVCYDYYDYYFGWTSSCGYEQVCY